MASFHAGKAGVKPAKEHNRREPGHFTNNVDTKEGFYEIIIDKNVDDVVKELFEEPLAQFNAKQKKQNHHSRIHDLDYYVDLWNREINGVRKKDGKKFTINRQLERETVVYFSGMTSEDAQKAAHKYVEMIQQRYGENMIITGAYFHADERRIDPETGEKIWSEPHLHLDYIMIANNQKRGLKTTASMSKGVNQLCEKLGITEKLEQEGIKVKQMGKREYRLDAPGQIEAMNALDAFTAYTLKELDEICAEKGVYSKDYDLVTHGRSRGEDWLSKEEYVELKEREKAQRKLEEAKEELKTFQSTAEKIKDDAKEDLQALNDEVLSKAKEKSDLESDIQGLEGDKSDAEVELQNFLEESQNAINERQKEISGLDDSILEKTKDLTDMQMRFQKNKSKAHLDLGKKVSEIVEKLTTKVEQFAIHQFFKVEKRKYPDIERDYLNYMNTHRDAMIENIFKNTEKQLNEVIKKAEDRIEDTAEEIEEDFTL